MSNLLQETIKILANHGKKPEDVLWVGVEGKAKMDWHSFSVQSDREYEGSFGHMEVRPSLVVVGVGWWLERNDYDGSEWWEFKTLPTEPEKVDNTLAIFKDNALKKECDCKYRINEEWDKSRDRDDPCST